MHIQSAVDIAPHLQAWYDEDISVYVFDTEKVLAAINHPKINLGVNVGDLFEDLKSTISYKAIMAKQRLVKKVDLSNSQFGIPYVAISNPIFDNDQIAGVMTVVVSTEAFDALLSTGEEILAAVEQISASAENLVKASEELAANAQSMSDETEQVQEQIGHVSKITDQIKSIAAQSNILGINSSIEAARAGEAGRGFAVVAGEIRKLADTSKSSAVSIEDDVKEVENSVKLLIDSIGALAAVSEEQATGVSELTKALEQISSLAQALVKKGKRE